MHLLAYPSVSLSVTCVFLEIRGERKLESGKCVPLRPGPYDTLTADAVQISNFIFGANCFEISDDRLLYQQRIYSSVSLVFDEYGSCAFYRDFMDKTGVIKHVVVESGD